MPLMLGEPPVATGDGDAWNEAFHVPLERARKRLVEVVYTEDQATVGRCEHAEVGEMGIAGELRAKPRARTASEIRGHHGSCASKERERRQEHPPVADGHKLGHPQRGLLFEHLNRIPPPGRSLPDPMGRTRRLLTRRLPTRKAVGPREA